jgi:hypothetical protein
MLLPPSRFSEDPSFPTGTWVHSFVLEKWLVAKTFEAFAKVLAHLSDKIPIIERYSYLISDQYLQIKVCLGF